MDSADANAARLILARARRPGLEGRPAAHGGRAAWRASSAAPGSTTTANLWGSLALDKFSATFESEPVGRAQHAGQRRPATRAGASTGRRQPEGGRLTAALARRRRHAARSRRRAAGKPWLTVQSLAAVPLKAPLRAGYRITRSVTRGRAEGQGALVARRRAARAARGRRAGRHDLGRASATRCPAAPRSSARAWAATRRSPRAASAREGSAWPALRGAQLRGLPQLLRVPAARQACRRVHACG